jgi:hypothetical protein
MAETTTKRRPVSKTPATHRRRAAETHRATVVDRTTDLSEEVLKSFEAGERAVIEAVRKFVDTVERTRPHSDEEPSRRQEIVDSAMEMADRLVHTQFDFLRKVIDSAAKSVRSRDDAKPKR